MRSPQGETHRSARINCSAKDRLAGDSYDANGNTMAATLDGQSVTDTYTTGAWERSGETARMRSPQGETHGSARVNCSYRNRLVERTTTDGKTIRITYDGDGHRVREAVTENGITTTTDFLVDTRNPTGYAQVVEEIVHGTVTTVHTYGHDLISQDVRQPGGAFAASFYCYDGHGSVRQLTDSLGQVTDAYTYDAFGVLIDSHGATTNSYLYAGEQFDSALGLYYNRARHLNAANGRFWTMDAYEGRGMEPATLHKYLYAHADPVNGVDPSGFLTLGQKVAVTSIITTIANTAISGYAISRGSAQLASGEPPDGAIINLTYNQGSSGLVGGAGLSIIYEFSTGQTWLIPIMEFGLSPITLFKNHRRGSAAFTAGLTFGMENPSDFSGVGVTATWPLVVAHLTAPLLPKSAWNFVKTIAQRQSRNTKHYLQKGVLQFGVAGSGASYGAVGLWSNTFASTSGYGLEAIPLNRMGIDVRKKLVPAISKLRSINSESSFEELLNLTSEQINF